MIGALVLQDQEAFDLHAAVISTGAALQSLRRDPSVSTDQVTAAEAAFFEARAQLHEKCALEAA